MPFEYEILARRDQIGNRLELDHFPELQIEYTNFENNLSLHYYANVKGGRESELKITFIVNNQPITITSQDRKRGKIHVVWIGTYHYIFQGLYAFVQAKSRERTFMVFRVLKVTDNWR